MAGLKPVAQPRRQIACRGGRAAVQQFTFTFYTERSKEWLAALVSGAAVKPSEEKARLLEAAAR